MKYSIDEIHEYLSVWKRDDVVDDYVIAHDSGYTEILIHMIQGTGALNTNIPIENYINNYIVSDETFRQLCDECFKNCIVMTNPNTNETWWIPNLKDQGVEYFVSENECIDMGYTDKWIFK